MRNLSSKEALHNAVLLMAIIEQRRIAEKKEKELKEFFRAEAQGEGSILAGDILITFSNEERAILDKKSLITAFGENVIKQFERITEYIKIDVKKA